jgi:hypothetical protein
MSKRVYGLGILAVLILASVGIAAYRSSSFEMTPTASSPIASGVGGMYTKSTDGRVRLVSSGGTEYRSGTASDIFISAGAPGGAVLSSCWMDSTDNYRLWCKESAGNLRQRFDGTAPGTFGCGTPAAGCFTSVTLNGAPTEAWFSRTCTITSAAAATPITCLADADVPLTHKAYVAGWHAKVNGATPWATTATCSIADSGSISFVSIAVAALTANAYIVDTTANVTLQNAYTLNTGGGADKGLQVYCNANGTGSDLVVTVYGVIK